MPITDAHITPGEYRGLDAEKTDTGDDIAIDRGAKAISRLVEETLGQFFVRDAAVVNRVFVARHSNCLDLDYEGACPGIATAVGVLIKVDTDADGSFADETAWASTDYELLPRQAALGPEPKPYTQLVVPAWGTQSLIPGQLVQVTAVFGWPAVPEMVKLLTAKWLKIWRLEGPEGTGRITEMGAVVNMSLDVKRLVDRARYAYGKVAL